jgi:xanthine/CO dehydrogenase XdhC/CoxF family maturation factor/cation diffusion facilitator CzcD-associated flavoprotein CzcO
VREVTQAVLELLQTGQRGALATVVRTAGSTPQVPGARLLLRSDGSCVGTVGGGAIELAVLAALQDTLRSGVSEVLVRELGYDLGMCCGGRMEVLIEPIEAPPRLTLFGAGHVAKPTAALARKVGFEVRVIDERAELATPERFPDCELALREPVSVLRRETFGERDWLLIMTHDHQLDEQLLALALPHKPRYIGLIGSRRKVFRTLQRLAATQTTGDLSRVYAPVGLKLGALGPDEIAVSIVSELIALRRGEVVPHMSAVDDTRLQRTLAAAPGSGDGPRVPPPSAAGLAALTERVRSDLEHLDYPQREWLTPRRTAAGGHVYDALIVGAGQGGLATAFGLLRERVRNLLVVDQNPLDRAGPWLNFARMRTLRTPKHVTGPDLGIPSLTPRAYFEALHGLGSWGEVGLLPKETWAAYLAWYRETLGIPVRPETRVGALRWDDAQRLWQVPCTGTATGKEERLFARRVVLATGIEGSGQWDIPRMISDSLPRERYAHTRWEIEFAALSGKRVAVLGAGASAFDNAATALEHGASEVRLFFRRHELVKVNAYRWAESVGFLGHHADLPDADKWRFILQILRMGQLPPADTLRRASEHAGFHLQPGSAWKSLEVQGDEVLIHTQSGRFACDFVIVGTGFITDLKLRPELSLFEAEIARWADRYTPSEAERSEDLARHPYLGPSFEFTERTPGAAPYLKYLYNFTFGGLASLGFGGASISGMKYSIPRLVGGLAGSLFVEDRERHFESLRSFADREF